MMKNRREIFGRMAHELEGYVKRAAKKYGAQVTKGDNGSTYVRIGGRVLRISDHIGRNSSGVASIIVPQAVTQAVTQEGSYILHIHQTGSIRLLTISQVREFIRTFMLVSDFLEPTVTMSTIDPPNPQKEGESILGYPKECFTEGQINHVKLFIRQNRNRGLLPR